MKLIYQVKEFGAFLLIWGFVGVPNILFAYFDTQWSRYFWIGVVVLYTFTLAYAYIFKKTGEDKTVDMTSRNSEQLNFDDMVVDGNRKSQNYLPKK